MKPPTDPVARRDLSNEQTAPLSSPVGSGLAREIAAILVIKAAVLFVIWWTWFSAPAAHHMQMPAERVHDRLIQAPAVQPPPPPQSLTSGNRDHATR